MTVKNGNTYSHEKWKQRMETHYSNKRRTQKMKTFMVIKI